MTTADFRKVRELFLAAKRLSGPAREIYLAESCGDEAELRAEVESLLANHDEPAAGALMIDVPALGTVGSRVLRSAAGDPLPLEVPERIGHYRVVRPIGEGAMGCVYEAEQDNPRRRVALKVLRTGALSEQVLQRFQREAQILGRLHHPGIAQVLEAGTFGPPGRPSRVQPYFAMEFIEGEPLTKFAADARLDVRGRLKLIAKICDAVQHAHDRGVIHRDLKPANIMVVREGGGDADSSAQPKVLDFGVARAADSDLKLTTIQTGMGQLIGTVAYMSPEQARGDPTQIDERSDVYALGVICYELLAGRLPYSVSNRMLHEAVRVIREEDPAPLSSINRVFRGDVETIVAKAMEKERERRYSSAGAMAADIRRFLADEPIIARPATRVYHLKKFAKRNKMLVAGLGATAAALFVGTVVSTGMYFKAEAARKGEATQAGVAKTRAEEAGTAKIAAEQSARRAKAVNEFILQRMLRAADPRKDGREVKVADVLDKAAAETASFFSQDPDTEAEIRRALALTYQGLGLYKAGLAQAQLAYELGLKTVGPRHRDTVTAAVIFGQAHIDVGHADEAIVVLRRALADLGDEASDSDDKTLDLLGTLGDALQQSGQYDEAEPMLRRVVAAREALGSDPDNDLVYNFNILGSCLYAERKYEESEVFQRRFYELAKKTDGLENPVVLAGLANVANLMVKRGAAAEAEPILADCVRLTEKTLGPDHVSTGVVHLTYGSCLEDLGRIDDAEAALAKGVRIVRQAAGDDHFISEQAMQFYYEFLSRRRGPKEAEAVIAERLEMRRKRNVEGEEVHMEVLGHHIAALNRIGRCADGEIEGRQAVALAERLYPGENDPRVARVQAWLGESLVCLKRYDEAEAILLRCYELQNAAAGLPKRDAPLVATILAQLYDRSGKPDEAQRWAARGPR